jgi:D-3-phosphoglycerate dehydrogenase
MGRSELALVKEGALLLNAARGGQVDESSLVEALQKGRIAGAWLDVFTKEPYQGILSQYPQVLLTPHVGSYTRECRREMESDAVENLIRGFMREVGGRR